MQDSGLIPLERDLVYLATPYTHKDLKVQTQRYVLVTKAAAWLLRHGHMVYSPITHCHPMAVHGGLPNSWQFWRHIDTVYLRHSRMLVLLPLPGWERSVGVAAEIDLAHRFGVKVCSLAGDLESCESLTFSYDDPTLNGPPTGAADIDRHPPVSAD